MCLARSGGCVMPRAPSEAALGERRRTWWEAWALPEAPKGRQPPRAWSTGRHAAVGEAPGQQATVVRVRVRHRGRACSKRLRRRRRRRCCCCRCWGGPGSSVVGLARGPIARARLAESSVSRAGTGAGTGSLTSPGRAAFVSEIHGKPCG